MGNCLTVSCASNVSKKPKPLPIEIPFKLPVPVPTWPPGEGNFAGGSIDLGGGLEVCQISSFNKVWATNEGGPDNQGASFFEPSPVPEGFSMLGCYSQPNNKPLFGWILAAKDNIINSNESTDNEPLPLPLVKPIDYTLLWSSESLKIRQDKVGYFWLPIPPDGYNAVGHVITNSPEKPPLDKIRCVRSDLTDLCEADKWIWGPDKVGNPNPNGFNVYGMQPKDRGVGASAVSVGTFVAMQIINDGAGAGAGAASSDHLPLACLKNIRSNLFSAMPNLPQIDALIQAYSPLVYLHPDERYLPSSVSWFFQNGALLYQQQGAVLNIDPTGSNLPQGGSNDGAYWLDLPVDEKAKETVKKGNLQDSMTYLHIKPMLGATFTDIAIWIFYPFNGPARAKVELINISLGKIGQHVGDWEHVTLRVSNFNGELIKVFFSEHSSGTWVKASELEFQNGNHVVSYASLHGHAFYPKPGLVLQGSGGIGIRNDTAKSKLVLDTGGRYMVVAADYLGSVSVSPVVEPPWLNYYREWGPKITYDLAAEIKEIKALLPGKLKSSFEKLVKSLPNEVLGEEGPTGPKMKKNWNGDEA